MEFKLFIGIDISKLTFDVCVIDLKGSTIGTNKFDNTVSGFKLFKGWIKEIDAEKDSLFCLEHTGVYSMPICVYFEKNGIKYSLQSGL